MNKIFIFGGLSLGSILFVENTVIGSSGSAYIFLWYSNPGTLVLVSMFVGLVIGYGIKGFFEQKDVDDDNYDF